MFRVLFRLIAIAGAGVGAAAVTLHLLTRPSEDRVDAPVADRRGEGASTPPVSTRRPAEVDADKVPVAEREALLRELGAQL